MGARRSFALCVCVPACFNLTSCLLGLCLYHLVSSCVLSREVFTVHVFVCARRKCLVLNKGRGTRRVNWGHWFRDSQHEQSPNSPVGCQRLLASTSRFAGPINVAPPQGAAIPVCLVGERFRTTKEGVISSLVGGNEEFPEELLLVLCGWQVATAVSTGRCSQALRFV